MTINYFKLAQITSNDEDHKMLQYDKSGIQNIMKNCYLKIPWNSMSYKESDILCWTEE